MSSRRVSMPSSLFKTIEEDPKDQCSGAIRGKTKEDFLIFLEDQGSTYVCSYLWDPEHNLGIISTF